MRHRPPFLLLLSLAMTANLSAQSFQWLGHLRGTPSFPDNTWFSRANGVSGDGTVAGDLYLTADNNNKAYIWKDGAFTELPFERANYINVNARVILGEDDLKDEQGGIISTMPVRWEKDDLDEVEVTPSVDGTVIVLNDDKSAFQQANGKWIQVGEFTDYRINAVSANGGTFVGSKFPGLPDDPSARAAVWTFDEETLIPMLPGTENFYQVDMHALAVSGDGSIVVGYANVIYSEQDPGENDNFAFIWTEADGVKTIADAAKELDIEWMDGIWEPEEATAISTDGKFVVGNGCLDGEFTEPWILELVPNPRDAIVVNVVGDDADADSDDEVIDVDLEKDGEQISLRAAIELANERPGLDRIEFDIEGPSPIDLGVVFELPDITDLVEIDGTTQDPSSPTPPIWLQFSGDYGLKVTGGDCVIRGLVISGSDAIKIPEYNAQNLSHGIVIRELGGNQIDFCFIGTNANGTNSRSIQGAGVFIDNSPDNIVSNCLLSGNWWAGVAMKGSSAFGNRIEENLIGTNASGNASIFTNIEIVEIVLEPPRTAGLENNLGNGPPDLDWLVTRNHWWLERAGGIIIENAPSNTITGNRISGNNWGGINLVGPGTTNTVIQNNNLGYDPDSESPTLRNVPGGNIRIIDSPNNLIGGESPSQGNQIGGKGVATTIRGEPARADGATIRGGASIDNKVQNNRFRDLLYGVYIGDEASQNTIGGNNSFVECEHAGVFIYNASNNRVSNNSFGEVGESKSAEWGVIVDADNNFIGGEISEDGNQFVSLDFGAIICGLGAGNTFRHNMHDSAPSFIDLWGTSSRVNYGDIKILGLRDPDRNDKNDSDTGGNNQLNHPLINVAKTQGSQTTLSGFLDTSTHLFSTTYILDFYESGIHVGQGAVNIGPAGLSMFNTQLPSGLAPGKYIYATATGPDGSTSEFGRAIRVDGSTSTDADGVSDEVEDLTPNRVSGSTSSAPSNSSLHTKSPLRAEEGFGDGNGDGILDSEQNWVASFPTFSGEFLTILTENENVALKEVTSFGPDWIAHSAINAPLGILDLGVNNFSEGNTVVEILLPIGSALDEIWYFGSTEEDSEPHWFEFSYNGTTGAEILEDRLRLHFVDGQRGDIDLEANGVILTSILPVQIGPGDPDLDVNPFSNSPNVAVTWPLGLTNPILEKSTNMADWEVIQDDPKTIDGRKSLEQELDTDSLFFRLTTTED